MFVVLESYQDGVYTITLNRPEKKNAMDYELLKDLHEALRRAEGEKAPIVVIRGSGGAFCSGGDIIAFKDAEDTEALIDAEAGILHESIKMIRNMNAIVIAAIEGVMVGAGVGLARRPVRRSRFPLRAQCRRDGDGEAGRGYPRFCSRHRQARTTAARALNAAARVQLCPRPAAAPHPL